MSNGLPTYPSLYLPTKRMGVEISDWFKIAPLILLGVVFQSWIISAIVFVMAYSYYGIFKHALPRGWLAAKWQFHKTNGWRGFFYKRHLFIARLELQKNLEQRTW